MLDGARGPPSQEPRFVLGAGAKRSSNVSRKEVETVPVAKVLGAGVSEAGDQLLVRIAMPGGEQFRIGVAADQVQPLLIAVSHGALELAAKREPNPQARQVMLVNGWDLLQSPDGALVLTVRLPGGGETSFQLPEGSRERLLAFAAAVQSSMTRSEDATIN